MAGYGHSSPPTQRKKKREQILTVALPEHGSESAQVEDHHHRPLAAGPVTVASVQEQARQAVDHLLRFCQDDHLPESILCAAAASRGARTPCQAWRPAGGSSCFPNSRGTERTWRPFRGNESGVVAVASAGALVAQVRLLHGVAAVDRGDRRGEPSTFTGRHTLSEAETGGRCLSPAVRYFSSAAATSLPCPGAGPP
jgi:hypothetical protein